MNNSNVSVIVIDEPAVNITVIEAVQNITSETVEVVTVEAAAQGMPGLSAYQVAVKNGFVGTEAQWLESLKPERILLVLADVPIGGHRVVVATENGCNYADSADTSHINRVIGMTKSAWSLGDLVEVFNGGEIIEPSWSWNVGAVYLGSNGLLTQIPPTTGFIQQIGVALSATKLLISIQQPIGV